MLQAEQQEDRCARGRQAGWGPGQVRSHQEAPWACDRPDPRLPGCHHLKRGWLGALEERDRIPRGVSTPEPWRPPSQQPTHSRFMAGHPCLSQGQQKDRRLNSFVHFSFPEKSFLPK